MEYKQGYAAESVGVHGGIGIKILVAIQRELSQEDGYLLSKIAEELHDGIMARTLALDPETAKNRSAERTEILALFSEPIYVEEIGNGYCSSWCCLQKPWFIVTTKLGRIKIGWRKRVLQIEWEGSAITATAEELFPNEDVTKGGRYIHAWGYEKAKQYLDALLATSKQDGG